MLAMQFLYFPEDKSEYLPATITLIIFMLLAVVVTYFMIKRARKEKDNFEDKYSEALKKAREADENLRS